MEQDFSESRSEMQKAALDAGESLSPEIQGEMAQNNQHAALERYSGDLSMMALYPRDSLPLPPVQPQEYRNVNLENIYASVEGRSSGIYLPMRSPMSLSSGTLPSAGKTTLYRITTLVFFSLWIITLIALITTLIFRYQHTPQLESGAESSETNAKPGESQNLCKCVKKEKDCAMKISELQMQLTNLDHFYSTEMMYVPSNTSQAKMSEMSRYEGIILAPVWRWIRKVADDVILDPDTAHPKLVISKNGKQVRLGSKLQNISDLPQRFNYVVNVLAKDGFRSGRHYWEVDVRGKTDWTLGVACSSVYRKGNLVLRPRAGYWTIFMKDRECKVNCDPVLPLALKDPQKVGVYVDYEQGQVSFYSVEDRSHIYSFTGYNFTKDLYPLFRPGLSDNGNNAASLVITPVSIQ
ncbi:erythroid membrane-associated protein-like isoform X1 [Scleropages formosus]|uniref:E3 ubiquitin-protein ligase TRIM39-like n=1 Tax=Scleropages formosus TaxID=113540 RepID=A0A8D0CJT1_SCLFO|nr:erythroid membrane-associated protein-like isoform X1 [Scleropages formosus]